MLLPDLADKVLLCTGHLACVKLLLQEGADIEQRNVVSNASHVASTYDCTWAWCL